jgi:hypothetical protein
MDGDEQQDSQQESLAGRKMLAGRAVQSIQMAMRAKGKPLGAVSPKQILEMVDSGVIDDSPAVQTLRKLTS